MSVVERVEAEPPTVGPAGPHIVHVVSYYPPHLGGMERVAEDIARALSRTGPVTVLTSDLGAGDQPLPDRPGLTVKRLSAFEVAHTPIVPGLLAELLRIPRTAVVHLHVPVAFAPELVWLGARLRGWRYVVHYHLDADPSGRLGRLFLVWKSLVLGRVLRDAAAVIAVSADQPETLQRQHRVDPDRIELIPNGIGLEFNDRGRDRPSRPFRLLFVGRLAPQKNVGLLLRSLARCQSTWTLSLVGDGEERAELEALVDQLGLRPATSFLGALAGSSLVQAYQQADALVLPSHKESTGLVLLEAMACGLPVIGTRVQGIVDTVGDDGLLVDPTPRDLAAAIDRLSGDETLWRELSARGLARAERSSWAPSITSMRRLYAAVGAPS